MKQEHPKLKIVLNGGINTLDEAQAHLAHVDGVMLGRAAYQNPAMLAEVDARFFGGEKRNLDDAVADYAAHVEKALADGARLNALVKPMLGLFNGRPGARQFRRHLSENAPNDGAGIEVLREALAMLKPQRVAA